MILPYLLMLFMNTEEEEDLVPTHHIRDIIVGEEGGEGEEGEGEEEEE